MADEKTKKAEIYNYSTGNYFLRLLEIRENKVYIVTHISYGYAKDELKSSKTKDAE